MKAVQSGILYKLHNHTKGMQTLRFHREGEINDSIQDGTSIKEVLKMLVDKLNYDNSLLFDTNEEVKDKNFKLLSSINIYLKS